MRLSRPAATFHDAEREDGPVPYRQPAPSPPGSTPVDLAGALYLAAAVYIKCIPGSLRESRHPSEMSADEFAKLVAAVARLHLTLNSFVYVQIAIGILTGFVEIAISWLLISARQRNRFVVIAAYIICLQAHTRPISTRSCPEQPIWQGLTVAVTFLGICGFFLVPFIFPDGRLVPKWTIFPVMISFVLNAIASLAPYRIIDSVAGQVLDAGTGRSWSG